MNVLVITPTYNERDNLPRLVAGVLSHPRYRIMVVDDNSPDGTGAVADALALQHPGRVEVVHRTGPRGLGLSYLDGLRRALTTDADRICQMDADLSHDPQDLPELVAATERCDLALGSRYVRGGSVVNWPLHRLLMSTFANRYVRFVTHLSPRDCTAGFRCWRREALARLALDRVQSDGYAFLVEMLYEASRAGCTIAEVPICFVERRLGSSKMSRGVMLESAIMPWRMVLRSGWRSRK